MRGRGRQLLMLIGALALVALASPALSAAAECPPGEVGTPPYCSPAKPSNKFQLGKVKHPATGAVTIRVKVPGPGTFKATGKPMKTANASGKAAGSFTLKLQLTVKGLEALEEAKGHQLRVRVSFTFTPTVGDSRTKFKKPS